MNRIACRVLVALALVVVARPVSAQVTAATSYNIGYCAASAMPAICPLVNVVSIPVAAPTTLLCNLTPTPVPVPALVNFGRLEFDDPVNATKKCQAPLPPKPTATGIYNVFAEAVSAAGVTRSDGLSGIEVLPPQPPAKPTGLVGRP